MSLYLRGRIWWGKFTARGFATARESSGTDDRQAAQEWHDHRAAELWRIRRLGQRPRVAFADAAADWIESHARHKRSFADDKLRLATMLPLLPAYLDELTTTRLQKVRDQVVSIRGVAKSTANKYLAILSAILHHGHAREQITAVPKIPMFPKGRRRRWIVLTPEQAQALLNALPPHLHAITRFALATGLRDANVRLLRWRDVDLSARVALVWPEDAKAGESIAVALSDSAVEVLQAQLGRHPDYVFVYQRGKEGKPHPIGKRSNNTAWRRARKDVGLPRLRFHDLRHSWATWHAIAGTPELALQEMGGWSDPRMVRNYTHLAARHLLTHANAIRVPGTLQGTVAPSGEGEKQEVTGVADGIRTHNNRNHKAAATVVPINESSAYAEPRRARTRKKQA